MEQKMKLHPRILRLLLFTKRIYLILLNEVCFFVWLVDFWFCHLCDCFSFYEGFAICSQIPTKCSYTVDPFIILQLIVCCILLFVCVWNIRQLTCHLQLMSRRHKSLSILADTYSDQSDFFLKFFPVTVAYFVQCC